MELVRVADNGCGIPAEELPLAVASHATSKIAEADDLFRVGTLGFRGEALASIAEVSRLVLRSRTADSPSGAEIDVSGGQVSPVAPCGCPVGTTVEVRNLFFNTPVRRKFLRSTQTEFGHVSEAFIRIALACPQVHFTLRHNDRPVFELAGGEGWLERIGAVLRPRAGREPDLGREQRRRGPPVRLRGPSQPEPQQQPDAVPLPQRPRHPRPLACSTPWARPIAGCLMTGRYPIAFLSLEMPPELVDVNVHPTKLEVRFQDSGRLYSQLLSTLRAKFLTHRSARPGSQIPADDGPAGGARRSRARPACARNWSIGPRGRGGLRGERAAGDVGGTGIGIGDSRRPARRRLRIPRIAVSQSPVPNPCRWS